MAQPLRVGSSIGRVAFVLLARPGAERRSIDLAFAEEFFLCFVEELLWLVYSGDSNSEHWIILVRECPAGGIVRSEIV